MKISAQEEYGLRCLLQIARRGEAASPSITEIAEAEGLSAPYAAKLLALLRQEGFIESTRGRSGGYRLNRPPTEIRIGSVLTALGEHLFAEGDFCQKHAGTETTDFSGMIAALAAVIATAGGSADGLADAASANKGSSSRSFATTL